MARIDTHRAAYVKVNPNMKVGKSLPSKQSIIDRLTAIETDISRMNTANLPECERALVERAQSSVLIARRSLRIMITK